MYEIKAITAKQLERIPSFVWWCLKNPSEVFLYCTPHADTEAKLRAACKEEGVPWPTNLTIEPPLPQ